MSTNFVVIPHLGRRFGRLQDNILHANIVFGVINDEFEGEEYVATNRGEVYQVMNTIVEIVKNYMSEHPKAARAMNSLRTFASSCR